MFLLILPAYPCDTVVYIIEKNKNSIKVSFSICLGFFFNLSDRVHLLLDYHFPFGIVPETGDQAQMLQRFKLWNNTMFHSRVVIMTAHDQEKPCQLLDNAASNIDHLCGSRTPVITREIRETSWHTVPAINWSQMPLFHRSWLLSACMRGRMQRINLNTMPAMMETAIRELRAETPGSQLRMT